MAPKLKCDIEQIKLAKNNTLAKVGAFNKDDKIIGVADISILKTDKKFIWLHEIVVDPRCRRKGVGEAIIEAVADIGREKGSQFIYAFPSPPIGVPKPIEQKKIEAFYKNLGFKPCNAPQDVATVTDGGLFKRGVCLPLK